LNKKYNIMIARKSFLILFFSCLVVIAANAQFENVNILWQEELSQQPSPALAIENGPNNTWLVASAGFRLHQFSSAGEYMGLFFEQDQYNANGNRWNSLNFNQSTINYYGVYEAGGYTSRIIEINPNGELINDMNVTFGQTGIPDVVQTTSGDFIITGGKNCGGLGGGWDYRTGRVSSSGEMMWNTIDCEICGCNGSFCNYGDEFGYEIAELDGGEIVSAGYRNTGGTGCYGPEGSPYILKHTAGGELLWSWDGRSQNFFGRLSDIVALPDGNILVSGYKGDASGSTKFPSVIKVSPDGTFVSQWFDGELSNGVVLDIFEIDSGNLGLVVTDLQDMYLYVWNENSNSVSSKYVIPIETALADIDLSHGDQVRYANGVFTMIYSTGTWFDNSSLGLVQFTVGEITVTDGCTDALACNYNPLAIQDNGSCAYPSIPYTDCDGECINDVDVDGICDETDNVISTTNTTYLVPAGINYQAVARDAEGALLLNAGVEVQFTVLADSINGILEYSESHSLVTNTLGLFTAAIGAGIAASGVFSEINWSAGRKYLNIRLNVGGGYTDVGTIQILSVPYAMHSSTAGSIKNPGLPVFSNNVDALSGGLVVGEMYRTSAGVLMVVY
jgi:hypothetical protein